MGGAFGDVDIGAFMVGSSPPCLEYEMLDGNVSNIIRRLSGVNLKQVIISIDGVYNGCSFICL